MAKRKKYTINNDCDHCLRLEKKIEELTKTLSKYKKQTTKLRYKMNELENFARENDYLSKMIDTIQEEEKEILSEEKLGNEQEDFVELVRPDGKVVRFKKVDKLCYSKCKKSG